LGNGSSYSSTFSLSSGEPGTGFTFYEVAVGFYLVWLGHHLWEMWIFILIPDPRLILKLILHLLLLCIWVKHLGKFIRFQIVNISSKQQIHVCELVKFILADTSCTEANPLAIGT